MVRLPTRRGDGLWTRYVGDDDGTVEDWAHAAIMMRAVLADTVSLDLERGYTLDGVWWIVNDTVTAQ